MNHDFSTEEKNTIKDLNDLKELKWEVSKELFLTIKLHNQLNFVLLTQKHIYLYPGQAFCLWYVGLNPGTNQKSIAEQMYVATPTVSKILRNLEKKGLIERKRDTKDKRTLRIYLSEEGEKILKDIKDTFIDIINWEFEGMSYDDLSCFKKYLNQVSTNIIKYLERIERS
ncbi:MAG TPA: MarR family transcriptional regulator [Defluviitoga sp.]|nr:MarR family transcriptional regulator [Defluviitoga sp.]HOP24314.1 MarR family transcriptional regulator [Defluviitoga sp.]HPZ28094.1 MarR family transcriptional regulator [Defluviitoga sp.]HQD61984.1 MarR family transcriptional regulator [Defluviitoga sp.]